jgi:hypothetical protein
VNTLAPILVFLLATTPVQSVRGRVRAADGKGLEDVFIFFGREVTDIAETAGDGTFLLPRHGRYVAFFREGYRPVITLMESGAERLDIVLESSQTTEWIVPSCKSNNPGKRIGFPLRFPVPRGARTGQGRDVDYSRFGLGIQQGKEWSWIEGGIGPNWANAGPREELIMTAAEFTVRSYRAGTWSGFDVKGQSATGEYWRYLGWVGQSVNYRVASKEVAAALDNIIDGACY